VASSGGGGDYDALRLCADASLVLPHAPPPPLKPHSPRAHLARSGNHSCAAFACTRWPGSGGGGGGEAAVTLADFGPAEVDRVTLAQALYMARRAEALAHGWTQWGNGGGGAGGGSGAQLDPQVRQAVHAGTGPMLTLLNLCGCATVRL
jgi:hypothetical protein